MEPLFRIFKKNKIKLIIGLNEIKSFIMLNQLFANSLIAGGIYSLIALGYTMVYGILGFINFAHGEICMWGAFIFYVFFAIIKISLILSIIISMCLSAFLGIIIERIAYKPLRHVSRLAPLITAIGLSIILQNAAGLIFGFENKSIFPGYNFSSYKILGAFLTLPQISIIVFSITLMFGFFLLIKKTNLGKIVRATGDDLKTAIALGVNVEKAIIFTFGIGSALAAFGGIMVGLIQDIGPNMGVTLGIAAFIAAVIGGIGNIKGAVLGGFLLGFAENFGIWFFPSEYKGAIAFILLIIFLLLRPKGILGSS